MPSIQAPDAKADRLTSLERNSLKAQLARWQAPKNMLGIVDALPSSIFLAQSGLEFLRDAWTAAEFGRLRGANRVRIIDETRPDFELELAGKVEAFEAVEALDPTRRRGDEFRDPTLRVKDDPIEDWIARAGQAPEWLKAACGKKAAKGYDRSTNLVIYLNLSEYGIRQREVEGSFAEATASVATCFNTVWILWQQRACLIWDQGALQWGPRE